eukprot:CAMPEP_0181315004 /NCGR_PEP_ID=MMETSP1101-20121128/15132_1 /TAXON_ID=46948 /ORGANISM="Rhodomonas abbreviata, Strain Caron Lab Isolate" /LENGTH=326 /DNA_ID=CAMNT_0023422159 /DNA_START=62 /DNA_END=1042 /DNA_ORIENTATION=-
MSSQELLPVAEFLKNTLVSEIPKEREPFFLKEGIEPGVAFKMMADQWVRACPVQNKDGTEIVGTLDLRDAAKYLVEVYKGGVAGGRSPSSARRKGSLVAQHPEWKEGAGGISTLASKRPFVTVPPDATVFDVAAALASGSHIVGVEGGPPETAGLSHVITQGMLFKFCEPKIVDLKIVIDTVMTAPVISVKTTDPAIKAFEVMTQKGISAIAVVDASDGSIVHNTSTSDVKMLFTGDDSEEMQLMGSIEDFLVKLRSTNARAKTKIPVTTAQKGDTLGAVLRKMSKTGYHHTWVVNQNRAPAGVLSLTDVFKKLSGGEGKEKCCIL